MCRSRCRSGRSRSSMCAGAPNPGGPLLGGALSARAQRRRTDRSALPVVDVRVAVAGDLGGSAPAVGEVQPPVAELMEIKEADDLAPRAEEHLRRAPGAEVDLLPERPERLRDLQDDLGVIPVREGLEVR